jgi:ABC-type oligopeptide transport system substrate-binding subunit
MQVGNRFRATALVSAGVFLVACGGGNTTTSLNLASPDKQILRANDNTEPNSYDPTQQTYSYERAVGQNTFEPLLKDKADLSDVQPAAAESYTVSSDGLTYTFHLRANAKWSDGQPVTASDWVYGYQHFLNPALAAGYVDPYFDQTIAGGANYGSIDTSSASAIDSFLQGLGLSAPDPHTFTIKLAHPAAYFKWVVTLWPGSPIRKDIVEKAAGGSFPSTDTAKAEMWANSAATIIGNGPFKISEIVSKDHVTLVPNAYYWDGPPHLQQIVYSFITDANTEFSKYQTGALDMIGVPNADVTTVRSDPVLSKQARLLPQLGTYWIAFNATKAPLNNVMLRMALSKSVDRNKLANDVEHGLWTPLPSFFPKGMNGYDNSDNAQSFDVAAAKADLASSGISVSDVNKLKLLTRNGTNSLTVNQFLVDQWNTNLGTNIQLDVIDSHTVTSRIRKGNFDIYGLDGWIADYPDDQDWADIFVTGSCHSLNWGCPTLPGYDALVNKADTELDATQRAKDYAAAQKILIDQAAVAFMTQTNEYDMWKPYVNGLTITPIDDQYLPGDSYYHNAYITQH